MNRGELGPETLRQYVETVLVDLSYEKIEDDPFPTPQEAQVWFRLGRNLKSAFVPLFIVDKENETVKAALLGELGKEILVSFPPTNFGHTRFYALEKDLEAIAKSPDEGR